MIPSWSQIWPWRASGRGADGSWTLGTVFWGNASPHWGIYLAHETTDIFAGTYCTGTSITRLLHSVCPNKTILLESINARSACIGVIFFRWTYDDDDRNPDYLASSARTSVGWHFVVRHGYRITQTHWLPGCSRVDNKRKCDSDIQCCWVDLM